MMLLDLGDFGTPQYLPVGETAPNQDYLQENMKWKHQTEAQRHQVAAAVKQNLY